MTKLKQTKKRNSQKGERTREKLKAGAARALEAHGYHNVKIKDVTLEAGVAAGLFHHYFDDIQGICLFVLSEFTDCIAKEVQEIPLQLHPLDFAYRQNLVLARRFEEAPGLMMCIIQASDEVPEFTEIWKPLTNGWNNQRLTLIEKNSHFSKAEIARRVWALGSMTDGFLVEFYLRKNKNLQEIVKSPHEIAMLTAEAWYRGVFSKEPPEDVLASLA